MGRRDWEEGEHAPVAGRQPGSTGSTGAGLHLARVAYEERMDGDQGRFTWRTDRRFTQCPRDDAGAYFRFLASAGYELSPIEDFSGSMSLSFSDPRFDEVKAPVDECKDKDMTYAAPLFVTAEFINNNTGEIKSQTVFMGDFPMMTEKGTFIINGTERVVVTQLVRTSTTPSTSPPRRCCTASR